MKSTRADEGEVLDGAADPKAVEAIGRALTAHYSSLIMAPLPDKFVELLAQLERDQASRVQEKPDALS
ncbi:MAG TPA: NepR family anti-sigma factor [Roseiarcus sp.]|nr:NepR family anti-sigma factor [Roseiarcus sp.]